MLNLDTRLFLSINALAGRSPFLDGLAVFSARSLIFLLVAAVTAAAWLRRRTFGLALLIHSAAAWAGAYLTNQLIGWLYFRPRPFVALDGVRQLVAHPLTDKSFPSDHAASAFALAVSVCFFLPRFGAGLVVLAVLVAASRVVVGVHYPLDVVVGAAIGTAWAWLLRGRLRRFEKRNLR